MNAIKTIIAAALFFVAGAVCAQEAAQQEEAAKNSVPSSLSAIGSQISQKAAEVGRSIKGAACESSPEMKVRGAVHGAAATALHAVADWTPNLFGAKDAVRGEARAQNLKEYTNKAGAAITGTICEL